MTIPNDQPFQGSYADVLAKSDTFNEYFLTPRIQERSKAIEPRANSRRFYKDNFPVDLQFRIRQTLSFQCVTHFPSVRRAFALGSRQVVGEKYDQSD
jgi:hypothetical protein